MKKNTYTITSDDYVENLEKFKSFLEDFFDLSVILEDLELYKHIGVRLVGPGYREGEDSPMLEHLQYNARHSLHGLRTALFSKSPINNISYRMDDIYLNKASGSLILTLDATRKYTEPIEFMKIVYEDIINENINPFKFDDNKKKERYQSIIKNLSDLASQKRLKEFFIIIDDEEFEIKNLKYLRKQSTNIYYEDKNIIGLFEGYKKGSDSFEIDVEKEGKYYCHLSDIAATNNEKYQKILDTISSINPVLENVKLKVIGKRVKPKTIEVESIEKLDN